MSKAKHFVLIILCNHIDKYRCDCNYCREAKKPFIKIIKNYSFFYSKFFYSKLFYSMFKNMLSILFPAFFDYTIA